MSDEVLGTTPAGQEILLGGISGLYYQGETEESLLRFVATPDRGSNGEPTDVDEDGEKGEDLFLSLLKEETILFPLLIGEG